MKKYAFLFCCLALMMSACNDDDNDTANILSHDRDNVTGPLLQAATWQAATRFSPAETAEFSGLRLTQVEYFMGLAPDEANVFIYGPGVNNQPGDLLYQASITNSINQTSWNTHRITTPIDITGEEIWIAINLVHQADQQSIGCDAGPTETGGDWLFSSLDNQWRTYNDRTAESINWNIRGIVEE